MDTKKILSGLSALAVILFIAGIIFFFPKNPARSPELPVYGSVKDFQLLDSTGNPFGLSSLKGKVWVANFVFTTCSGICPVMTKNMAALHRSYQIEEGIEFVSFSVNPENDTPEVLTGYARKFNADTRRWHFLTGARADISKVAVESFKVGDVKEPVFHSAYFILVDKHNRIRRYYEGTIEKEVQSLFRDIALLMKEGT